MYVKQSMTANDSALLALAPPFVQTPPTLLRRKQKRASDYSILGRAVNVLWKRAILNDIKQCGVALLPGLILSFSKGNDLVDGLLQLFVIAVALAFRMQDEVSYSAKLERALATLERAGASHKPGKEPSAGFRCIRQIALEPMAKTLLLVRNNVIAYMQSGNQLVEGAVISAAVRGRRCVSSGSH